jgi:hypothetical protein
LIDEIEGSIKPELHASLQWSVLIQMTDRLRRKHLNSIIEAVGEELPKRLPALRVSKQLADVQRETIADSELERLVNEAQKRSRHVSDQANYDCLLTVITEVYRADPRGPFCRSEKDDLQLLTNVFWSKGRLLPIKTIPHRAPSPFWQVYPADIAESLQLHAELRPARSYDLTSRLLRLHLVDTGALPETFRGTFSPGAIQKSLSRKPLRP